MARAVAPTIATGIAAGLVRNGAVLLAARGVAAVAGVVSVPVLYARLGERCYGVWALFTGLVTVAGLVDLGLGAAQIRAVATAAEGGEQRHARAVLAMGFVGGAGLAALAIALTLLGWPALARMFHLGELSGQARGAALLLVVGFVLDSLAMPWRAVLEGTQHYGTLGWVTGGTALLGTALVVLTALAGGGLVLLAASVALTSAARAGLLCAAARGRVPDLFPRWRDISRCDVTSVLAYGIRVQASNAGAVANNEMDRLVLGGFFDLPTLAGFDLGSRLVNLLRMLPSFALPVLFPAAAAMVTAGESQGLNRLYLATTRLLAGFAAAGAAALLVSADPLVRLWFGHPVPIAAQTIVVLAPGCAVSVVACAAGIVTRAEGFPGRETRCTVLAAVLNLALTIPLMRAFGPIGVPLATTVVVSLITIYFFAHFHRDSHRQLRPLIHTLCPPLLAGAAAVAITWFVAARLPDGPGRGAAALAVVFRGGLAVLLVAVGLKVIGLCRNISRAHSPGAATAVKARDHGANDSREQP
ncbi:lipopolysaccharide biosynthesis protein [Gandjariella thermophila]|uniref:Uncharacterized protein n=1 Tax=Gandjariella thermophila TaxID=1931992 RepID=A0A4D4JI27_9PSEU|nr:lipopolysaccharide biosynthesis protein [Gandjariella thermophila]GDY33553.1 hypothetical protein GTS_51860 [Gandjariella thermophila]